MGGVDAAADTVSLLPALLGGLALGLYGVMARPAMDSRRWGPAIDLRPNALILGGLGVAVLAALFWNTLILVPIIIVGVMVHEYGHVIAYRLTGHRSPVFRLVPFGGVAISDQRARSQAEKCYVALMGPGFSLALVVLCLLVGWIYQIDPRAGPGQSGDAFVAGFAYFAAAIIGALNLFNLLPFYPLDGGRAVRAIASVGGSRAANVVAIGMSAALCLFAVMFQLWILLLVGIIGMIASQQETRDDDIVRPMSGLETLLATAAYLTCLMAHTGAAAPLIVDLFGLAPAAATAR